MNSLSWFLYLADVSPKFVVGVFLCSLFAFIVLFAFGVYNTIEYKKYTIWKYLGIPVIGFFIAAMIPSKETMYAIAASEIGETAVKSKLGQKISLVLENWLDTQLQDKPKVEQK